MSFLFGGSGGSTTTTNSSGSSSTNYTPQYNDYVNNILSTAQNLGNTPFPAYDISKMYAPFQPAQNQAFNQVQQNQGAYQPYVNSATGALNNVSNLNPAAAASPWMNQAMNTPNPYAAGSGYLSQSAQGWNPQTQSQYTNPFLSGALGYSSQLAQQNLMENTLPAINDQFIKSGGGFGRDRNQEFLGRATRDFNNAQLGQYNTAAANNYWQGANQFNTDQSRLAAAGSGLGNLASGALTSLGNMGQTAANITGGAVNTGTGLANAYSNLGGALSNLNLTNTNALLQTGNQQQQQAQNPLTAQYQQFQQGVQWPFQLVNFMNAAQRGLQIPSTTQTQSTSTANQTGGSSPSIAGGILGGISSIMGIPGVADWTGGMLSNLFGGMGQSAGQSSTGGFYPPGSIFTGGGSPGSARGGYIGPKYARGGGVLSKRNYFDGGGVGGFEPNQPTATSGAGYMPSPGSLQMLQSGMAGMPQFGGQQQPTTPPPGPPMQPSPMMGGMPMGGMPPPMQGNPMMGMMPPMPAPGQTTGAPMGPPRMHGGMNRFGQPRDQMMDGLGGPNPGAGFNYAQGGGVFSRRREPDRRFAVGGRVPITKGAMSNPGPSMRALMGTQGRPPQMMPPGMAPGMQGGLPPMPPPLAAGALRGMGSR